MSGYILSNEAASDLDAILEYIAEDSIQSAIDAHARFLAVFRMLGENPDAGHFREDLTSRAVRFFPVYSYMVVYLAGTIPVDIVRVLGATKDVETILR